MEKDRIEISPMDLFRMETSEERESEITDDIPFREGEEEEVEEEVEEEETSEDSEEYDTEEEVEVEDFENTETEENIEEEEEEEEVYSSIVNYLLEEEVVSLKEGKEYDESPQGFKEVIEDTIEDGINKYKEELSEVEIKNGITAKDFVDYVYNGGNIEDFLEKLRQVDYKEVDITNVGNQKNLITEYLINEGLSEEEAEEMVTEYEDLNGLEKQAKLAQRMLAKKQDEDYSQIIKSQEESKIQRDALIKQKEEEFKDLVFSTKKIANSDLTEREQSKFYDFMTKPVSKDSNGVLYTQQQIDMLDPTKRLELMYFQFKGGISELEKKIETKKTLNLKKALSRVKDINTSSSTDSLDSGSGRQAKTTSFKLPSFFNNL